MPGNTERIQMLEAQSESSWLSCDPIGADEEVRMTTVGAGSFVINVCGYLITA